MTANELRIGNLVYDDFKEVHRVEGIQSDDYSIGRNPQVALSKINGLKGFYQSDHIFPIPLTEEWLLKFGFFKSTVFNGYDIRKGSLIINLERNGDEFLVIFLKIAGRENLNSIKYVHQLQNLYFALTGEELNLKS